MIKLMYKYIRLLTASLVFVTVMMPAMYSQPAVAASAAEIDRNVDS